MVKIAIKKLIYIYLQIKKLDLIHLLLKIIILIIIYQIIKLYPYPQ